MVAVALGAGGAGAGAAPVAAVFRPDGPSFYDVPFPHELRRDADGTASIAGFPFPSADPVLARYVDAIEQAPGFGVNSGVFLKFDGEIDVSTLPAGAAASRAAGASVFLINIDPGSGGRGERVPLWMGYRSQGDAYRDDHLLALMPVPGHPLAPGTLYAAVVTDGLLGADGRPVSSAPAFQRLKDETPRAGFEAAALPLYRKLWEQLETREALPRQRVVTATAFRTSSPAAELAAVARFLRRAYRRPAATNVTFVAARSLGSCWVFAGNVVVPQFQRGAPPFVAPGTGMLVFDTRGNPVVQREDSVRFVLCVPKETVDGTVRMPRRGWPVALYMHGTGGSRFSFLNNGTGARLADAGVASISFDQPLHGLRAGGPGDIWFFNVLNPFALRDNPRQAASDALVIHRLLRTLRIDPSLIDIEAGRGFRAPRRRVIRFGRRLFMGHSQGAVVGALFLGVARGVRGGVLSAGGGHLILNILTREESFLGGGTLRDMVETLLGGPVDLFHPALHLLQTMAEVSDPLSFAAGYAAERRGRPLSILFTHGLRDGVVPTPLTVSLVVAGHYPLIAPAFPGRSFPALPGYSYEETFWLAGLSTFEPPVSGNISGPRRRPATGGLVLFENDGHNLVFEDPGAIAQWQGFMRSAAYDRAPTIPRRP